MSILDWVKPLVCQLIWSQPPCFRIRLIAAGLLINAAKGRIGRGTKLPEQFGHTWFKTFFAHSIQNVHSKVQISASADSGGRSLSQHSQLGRSSNIAYLCYTFKGVSFVCNYCFVRSINFSGQLTSLSATPLKLSSSR